MDTLSSSVSNLKVPALNLTPREFHYFQHTAPQTSHLLHHRPHLSSSTKTASIPNKTSSFTHKPYATSQPLSPTRILHIGSEQSPSPHSKPSTGYAAALVDIAQSSNCLHSVENDIRKFLGLLKAVLDDPLLSDKEKGRVVGEVVEKGRFHRHLVRLVKMLVGKNKVGIVKDVLEEFERIYDELCGTQVVLVPSVAKMREDQLFGIAKRVQNLSGALRVKVRNFFHQSSASFAA